MSTILQRVLQTIAPYRQWRNDAPNMGSQKNGRTGQSPEVMNQAPISPAIDQFSSYAADIKLFGERMMPYIQSGALTQEMLEKALQERNRLSSEALEQKKQEVIAAVDQEIATTYQSLPESQRQRFSDNIDRQARIDEVLNKKIDAPWSILLEPEQKEKFSWQTDLIAKIVQDPDLDKLAASIRTKEPAKGYSSTNQSRMDSYSNSPLGGPLVALRVQQAAKSPATLQAFVSNAIGGAGNRNVWGSEAFNGLYSGSSYFPSTTGQQEDTHTVRALAQTGYAPEQISGIVYNALMAADLPVSELKNFSSYIAQLSPEDSAMLKTYYVQQFAQIHLVNNPVPISPFALHEIEQYLENPTFADGIPQKHFDGALFFKQPSAAIGSIADVLLQDYDIDAVVPMLEAYQGNQAIDGSLSAAEMVSDVRAYLNERTNKTPAAPEENSDLQLS